MDLALTVETEALLKDGSLSSADRGIVKYYGTNLYNKCRLLGKEQTMKEHEQYGSLLKTRVLSCLLIHLSLGRMNDATCIVYNAVHDAIKIYTKTFKEIEDRESSLVEKCSLNCQLLIEKVYEKTVHFVTITEGIFIVDDLLLEISLFYELSITFHLHLCHYYQHCKEFKEELKREKIFAIMNTLVCYLKYNKECSYDLLLFVYLFCSYENDVVMSCVLTIIQRKSMM